MYMDAEKELQRELKRFPKLNVKKCTDEANSLFTPYLFFRGVRSGRRLWSSCCGKEAEWPYIKRTMTANDCSILYGRHNETANCPFCGRKVTLKNVSKIGKRKNLCEYQPVVFLRASRGNLFACAYWARKDYKGELTAPPEFQFRAAYVFTPGKATIIEEEFWSGKLVARSIEGNYDPNHRTITEPFTESCMGGYKYIPYTVFGIESIARSEFRYCQYDAFYQRYHRYLEKEKHSDLLKYLAACCIWLRDIEMLMKMGIEGLVGDLVIGRSKNKKAYQWGAATPQEAFRLDGQELRAWMQYKDTELLPWYRKLKRAGMKTGFAYLSELSADMGHRTDECVKYCIAYKIRPERLCKYLNKFTGPRCYGGYYGMESAFGTWKDYVDMAERLERDLTVHNVLFPRELELAHNEMAQEQAAMLAAQREEEKKKLDAERLRKLESRQKKYNIYMGDYFIRVAESVEEVRNEGAALQHCVGGYAQRHMDGKTTILFLRRANAPDVPLYTIEMQGSRLVQIHGYKNESGGAPSPKITMSWMLTPWLAWVEAGSKRDKNGNPIIKEAKTA